MDEILKWIAEMDESAANRLAARTAARLVEQWKAGRSKSEYKQLSAFERLEDE